MKSYIDKQRAYFASNATLPLKARQLALTRLRQQIIAHEAEINLALRHDLGKGPAESYLSETGLVLKEISHILRRLGRWLQPRRVCTPLVFQPASSFVHYQPLGVVLILAPWNYPLLLSLLPLVDALAAGNCAIVKPSPKAPAIASLLGRIVGAACPPQLALVLEGDDEMAGRLLDEKFDFIFYTGSARVGRLVMRAAARHLTPVCLELGGKSPVIVAKDANLKLAARRIAWGKLLNAGQTCVAPDHVWAEESIANELAGLLRHNFTRMLGPEPLNNPDYGRIVDKAAFERLLGLGALVYDRDKLKIAPCLIPSQPHDPIMREEIFGPLLPLLTYNDIQQPINHIKSADKPLGLYIFSRSRRLQQQLLNNLTYGGACVNDVVIQAASPYLGFGGVGNSGMGRYHGQAGFALFSNPAGVIRSHMDLPVRYPPYGGRAQRLIRALLK